MKFILLIIASLSLNSSAWTQFLNEPFHTKLGITKTALIKRLGQPSDVARREGAEMLVYKGKYRSMYGVKDGRINLAILVVDGVSESEVKKLHREAVGEFVLSEYAMEEVGGVTTFHKKGKAFLVGYMEQSSGRFAFTITASIGRK